VKCCSPGSCPLRSTKHRRRLSPRDFWRQDGAARKVTLSGPTAPSPISKGIAVQAVQWLRSAAKGAWPDCVTFDVSLLAISLRAARGDRIPDACRYLRAHENSELWPGSCRLQDLKQRAQVLGIETVRDMQLPAANLARVALMSVRWCCDLGVEPRGPAPDAAVSAAARVRDGTTVCA